MYDKKILAFIDNLEMIRKNRHAIKIKINDNLIKLTAETIEIVEEATTHLRNFDK